MSLEQLLKTVQTYNPKADLDTIRLAYDFAKEAHKEQRRMSGDPYITHPLAVSRILADLHVPTSMIVTALLHDVVEDTQIPLAEIEKNFGKDVAQMVHGLTKLGKVKYRGVERYVENLRKMFFAMAKDVRVIVIKLADRLHSLQTLDSLPESKRRRIALESIEIFAPIANRLGMGEMKGQLEDLAFPYVHPKEYEEVKKMVEQKYRERKDYLEKICAMVEKEIKKGGVKFESCHGRLKHIYSLWCKLKKNGGDISKIYDLIALRIIVQDLGDCYAALGMIHKIWRPLKGRIKDYIAQPKPNGYRSLHTTAFCEDNEIVEFQIRTPDMHEEAEFGIAAHWNYDERGATILPRQLQWVKELAHTQTLFKDPKDLELLKIDIFKTRIFVFTPKGDVIDLPEDATSVDLAYAIHTDIGNTCIGARINDEMVSLDRPLKNGDVVEILTDKNRKGPSLDWLKFAKTNNARGKIKSFARTTLTGWIKSKVLPK